MGFYKYKARTKQGIIESGVIEGKNLRECHLQLKSRGLRPINLTPTKDAAGGKLKNLSLKEKIDFTRTFQTLHQAGVPILDSLVFIGKESSSTNTRNMARTIRQDILEGGTFASSIGKYPKIFDKIYAGLIKAGEDSGELEKTLTRLSELLKKQNEIKGKVRGAMIYPVFVIVLAFLIVTGMIVFVFPRFGEMFEQQGKDLPMITQACIDLGHNVREFWYVYIISAIAVIFLMVKSFSWPPTREIIDKVSLKVPVIKDLVEKSNFSNFLTVLMVAYNAGIPIVDCVYLANLTLTNCVLKEALTKSNKEIQQGKQLSLALRSSGVVPKMVIFMISTGEQSGKLGDLLENVVFFIDDELDKTVDVMTKLMEPMLIVVIGVIVLFMALAFYLPLFQLSQQ